MHQQDDSLGNGAGEELELAAVTVDGVALPPAGYSVSAETNASTTLTIHPASLPAGAASRRRDCHSATPPLPLAGVSIGINKGVSAKCLSLVNG